MKRISKLSLLAAPVMLCAGIACADAGSTAATTSLDLTGALVVVAVVLGGAGAVLGGVSTVLHAVAPRTRTLLDDRAATAFDALHIKLDQVVAEIRAIVPLPLASSSSPPAAPAALAPSSSSVAKIGTVALLALGLGLGGLLPACNTLGPAAANGLVATLDCEAKHFSTQMLIDATELADSELRQWLAGAAATSTTMVAADLAPFDSDAKKCALAGILAGVTAALGSPSSGSGASSDTAVATQGLNARLSVSATSAVGAPAQVRAAVSAAARQSGWPPIRVAGGAVL